LAGCAVGWWRKGEEENVSVKIYISIHMNIYVGNSVSECALGKDERWVG